MNKFWSNWLLNQTLTGNGIHNIRGCDNPWSNIWQTSSVLSNGIRKDNTIKEKQLHSKVERLQMAAMGKEPNLQEKSQEL